MIIHVEMCDHCGAPARGREFEAYKLSDSDEVYHICSVCQRKPFKRVVEIHPKAKAVQEAVRLMLLGLS